MSVIRKHTVESIPPPKQLKKSLSVVAVGSLIIKKASPSNKKSIANIPNNMFSVFMVCDLKLIKVVVVRHIGLILLLHISFGLFQPILA
nr:hypothetical protein [uncultured Flavobacterium sp.]